MMKPLSPQQARVMILMAAGMTYEQIAYSLSITIHTIKGHLKLAHRKGWHTHRAGIYRHLAHGDLKWPTSTN